MRPKHIVALVPLALTVAFVIDGATFQFYRVVAAQDQPLTAQPKPEKAPSVTDPASATINWRKDYDSTRKEASDKRLPICLYFTADGSQECAKMDADMLHNPDVVKTLNRDFIPLKLNVKDGLSTYQLHVMLRVSTVPTIIVASPDGKILQTLNGYVDSKGLQMRLATAKHDAVKLEFEEKGKRDEAIRARELKQIQEFLDKVEQDQTDRFLDKVRKDNGTGERRLKPRGPLYYDLPPSERNKVQDTVVPTERKG